MADTDAPLTNAEFKELKLRPIADAVKQLLAASKVFYKSGGKKVWSDSSKRKYDDAMIAAARRAIVKQIMSLSKDYSKAKRPRRKTRAGNVGTGFSVPVMFTGELLSFIQDPAADFGRAAKEEGTPVMYIGGPNVGKPRQKKGKNGEMEPVLTYTFSKTPLRDACPQLFGEGIATKAMMTPLFLVYFWQNRDSIMEVQIRQAKTKETRRANGDIVPARKYEREVVSYRADDVMRKHFADTFARLQSIPVAGDKKGEAFNPDNFDHSAIQRIVKFGVRGEARGEEGQKPYLFEYTNNKGQTVFWPVKNGDNTPGDYFLSREQADALRPVELNDDGSKVMKRDKPVLTDLYKTIQEEQNTISHTLIAQKDAHADEKKERETQNRLRRTGSPRADKAKSQSSPSRTSKKPTTTRKTK